MVLDLLISFKIFSTCKP